MNPHYYSCLHPWKHSALGFFCALPQLSLPPFQSFTSSFHLTAPALLFLFEIALLCPPALPLLISPAYTPLFNHCLFTPPSSHLLLQQLHRSAIENVQNPSNDLHSGVTLAHPGRFPSPTAKWKSDIASRSNLWQDRKFLICPESLIGPY